MRSRENQGNIWTGNPAFLCFPSQKITEVNSVLLACSARGNAVRFTPPSPRRRTSRTISVTGTERPAGAAEGAAAGPDQIEHDVGEGEL